jgi:enoyl-CoA hydratase
MAVDLLPGPDSLVRYARRGPAAWLTLHRPARRNALTPALIGDLHRALNAVDADPRVRAVVITGSGAAFCAGADLDYFLERVEAPDGGEQFIAELLEPLARALRRLRESPRLTIAAVNGACYAGGIELLVACDLVIAADGATFCDAHSRRGLAPALGGTAGLVAALGPARALRMLALSEELTAAQLASAGGPGGGLISEVVAADRLAGRAAELAATAAERSPASIAAMKQAVQRCQPRPWDEIVAEDIELFRRSWASRDMTEGIAAFAERRPPRFGTP